MIIESKGVNGVSQLKAQTGTTAKNGLSRFLGDLKAGVPVRLLVAPAAIRHIQNLPGVFAYLKSLGVLSFHPVLPYADISLWMYWRLFRRNPELKVFSSACTGVNFFLAEKKPEYLAFLPPVYSPLLCAARYLTTYRGYRERLAFLTPCAQKWREFTTREGEELVHYNITIASLNSWLASERIDFGGSGTAGFERDDHSEGFTVAAAGSISAALESLLPGLDSWVCEGLKNVSARLGRDTDFWRKGRPPGFLEAYACTGGCSGGKGIRKSERAAESHFLSSGKPLQPDKIEKRFLFYEETLDPSDFMQKA